MNKFALPGSKVMLTKDSVKNGSDEEKTDALKHLTLGVIYTIIKVHSYATDWTVVMLKEFPSLTFNADCFVDVEKQSKEDDKKHHQHG